MGVVMKEELCEEVVEVRSQEKEIEVVVWELW